MAIGNLGRVRNTTAERAYVWIPPSYHAIFKITVTRDDGTIDDITDEILSMKIDYGVTDTIGVFSFAVSNAAESYTGRWDGMEVFKFYADYADTATTLRFKGRVEKVNYRDNKVEVEGRGEVLFVVEKHVSKTYSNQDVGAIIVDLFASYGEGRFDTSSVSTSTGTTLTITWSQKPFWDCVKDICNASGYDCYIDPFDAVKFFLRGSVTNATEGVVHDYNLMEVGDFARNLQDIKNRVIVYGSEVEGVQPVYTAEDAVSQNDLGRGVREYVITDDNVTSVAEAREVAEFELDRLKNPPLTGELTSVMLATIQPGEAVYASSPENNIPPGLYTMTGFVHMLGERDYKTEVTIEREPRKFGSIIKRRIEAENSLKSTSANPYGLPYSLIYLFNVDEGSHTLTQITSSVLKLETGSSGTWVSPVTALGANVTRAYVIVNATTATGVAIEVSGDGGITYLAATPKTIIDMAAATGQSLRIRATLSESGAQVDSLSVLYELETISSPTTE